VGALFCKNRPPWGKPHPYTREVPWASHPTKAYSQVEGGGGGGCAMHAFHSLCLVYMNNFRVPFPSFPKYPFQCMEEVRCERSTQHYFRFGCHGPFASSDVHTILKVPLFFVLAYHQPKPKTRYRERYISLQYEWVTINVGPGIRKNAPNHASYQGGSSRFRKSEL